MSYVGYGGTHDFEKKKFEPNSTNEIYVKLRNGLRKNNNDDDDGQGTVSEGKNTTTT